MVKTACISGSGQKNQCSWLLSSLLQPPLINVFEKQKNQDTINMLSLTSDNFLWKSCERVLGMAMFTFRRTNKSDVCPFSRPYPYYAFF